MMPKFRAYDEETETMFDVLGFDLDDNEIWSYDESYELNKCKIMQSTGLLDKNGVEIYEGDMVRYTWDLPDDVNATEKGKKIRVGKVFWSDWRASFAVGKKSVNRDLFRYVRNGNTVEVIGNIHENKEAWEMIK